MTVRRLRLLAVAVVPTAVDIGLLLLLRQGFGWILVVADLTAIAVASVVSYTLHRFATFGANPYERWVRHPGAFAFIAASAGIVDALVLRLAFVATGFTSLGGLFLAKVLSLGVAAVLRALGYRFVLSGKVAEIQSRQRDRPTSSGTLRFSVVVPAYREPTGIATTVMTIRRELDDIANDGGLEIIVVDDGSGDGTGDAALAAGADQVVVLPENRGKGGAVRAGVLASRGRCVAFTDADLEYDAPHLRRVLEGVESGWDVVIGNRQHPDSVVTGTRGIRAFGSRVVNRLATAVLLAAPRDTQCGLKGFRGDVGRVLFGHTRIDGFAFDIELLHLVELYELSLLEIPVRLGHPPERTTVRIVQDVIRLLRDLFRVRQWTARSRYLVSDEERSLLRGPVDHTLG